MKSFSKNALKAALAVWCFSVILSPMTAFGLQRTDGDAKRYFDALSGKCREYGWTDVEPGKFKWEFHRITRNKYPLIFIQFGQSADNCNLILGGVHGDELPTVYLLFKLAHYIEENPQILNGKCIVIAPLVNPDGFFSKPPQRVNASGIDLNRNFPTKEWNAQALSQWKHKYASNGRYYPGKRPATEQETLFQIALIKRFRPQKILTVHSPLGFYDFDGASSELDSLEKWLDRISRETKHPLKKFGHFPGSLGNYAGYERNIFTLTLELPSSEPRKGNEYFQKFKPAFLKFLDLSVHTR
jgi:protein MpaA